MYLNIDLVRLLLVFLGWEHKEKIINTFETKEISSQMECGDSVKFTFIQGKKDEVIIDSEVSTLKWIRSVLRFSGEHQHELLDFVAAKFHEEMGVFKLLVRPPNQSEQNSNWIVFFLFCIGFV